MKYTGIVISDIHVGAMNLEKLHTEYLDLFIKSIQEMKKLDFLIVAGDFFDHKFYLNDKEATMAYIMLKELINVCKEKNAVVRFVYGTESHECNQYDILSLLKIYDNIEVVKYAKEEELLEGLNVLYLPEEHLLDKDKYYEKYFSNYKKYDYIFGHGIIREVMKDAVVHIENNTSNESKRKKVPIFNSSELSKICKGQIYFGHYHMNYEIDDKIFSISSFSRWKFGEDGRKGFYILKCNPEKEKYENEFIENTMADPYKTVTIGYDSKIFNDEKSLNESLQSIDKLIERDAYNHVRFMFNIPKDIDNPEFTINTIKEKYKFKDKVKIEMVHGYIEEEKKRKKEKINDDNKKYAFIFDDSIPLEEQSSRFISIEYNKEIPAENISKYLYLPLNEIINGINVENE